VYKNFAMGNKTIEIKLAPGYTEEELRHTVQKAARVKECSYQILSKGLDARKKDYIHWQLRVEVVADSLRGATPSLPKPWKIPYKKRTAKVLVVGAGPAGFFAAYVLQQAGFQVTLIDRGAEVGKRAKAITTFEKTGIFDPLGTYTFGEGGAGTFSDGKLTSRSKHISLEKAFIVNAYIHAGAPEEIAWLTHPHIGSNNLRGVVKKLREEFQVLGGTVHFETCMERIESEKGKVKAIHTNQGEFAAGYYILAPGNSAYDTYRMLIQAGVPFQTKNFAIGSRAEHPQVLINLAQWGVEMLPGVKAAEYRLTAQTDNQRPVYTFCMCPGGIVVPATAFEHTNLVNGMSYYNRNGIFGNAACVAGVHPDQLAGKKVTPLEALENLENLETRFKIYTGNFTAPAISIKDFLSGTIPEKMPESSYPLGLTPAPLYNLLPEVVTNALREGLSQFIKKLKGYDQGILLGLESKTSSPIQALRNDNGNSPGFSNLFLAGEGSGYAGGIMSSAADGIKTAMEIIRR